jgi:hypothetical protein
MAKVNEGGLASRGQDFQMESKKITKKHKRNKSYPQAATSSKPIPGLCLKKQFVTGRIATC